MPKQKDLKRVVRTRMQKTGESYTTARLHLLSTKPEPEPDYAALARMSDETVQAKTGRTWREWVRLLDAAGAAGMLHRDIARHVASLGVPAWWSQSVTVGYERIRGKRAVGQRMSGDYEANKSKTIAAPASVLFAAFANARTRKKWLPGARVRSSTENKRLRIALEDGSIAGVELTPKGASKTSVSIQQPRLPDKASAERAKAWWAEKLEKLKEVVE
jgi:hypothetical protein